MENAIALYHERAESVSRQKQYRVMALLTFCVAVALPVVRLISYYLPIENETVSDLVFTVLIQVCVLTVMPFLFYKFLLKMNVKQIFAFSSFKKTKWFNLALAVPIGICCHVVTIWVSSVWQNILMSLGYTHSSSPLPEVFSAGGMILAIVLTGILPGFCEEFFNRGGLLTTVRGSFPMVTAIIIMGMEFGLFHQNITQVFYTMIFGAFMVFVTLKVKSVFPAMIIHFVNNTFAVINDYCSEYGFLNGGFYEIIYGAADTRPELLLFMFAVFAAVLVGLTFLLVNLNSAKRLAAKKDVIASSGYDHTNNRVVLVGEEDKEKVRELGLDKEVYGEKLKEDLYKPTMRDNAFFFSAVAVSVLTTLFSFILGYII